MKINFISDKKSIDSNDVICFLVNDKILYKNDNLKRHFDVDSKEPQIQLINYTSSSFIFIYDNESNDADIFYRKIGAMLADKIIANKVTNLTLAIGYNIDNQNNIIESNCFPSEENICNFLKGLMTKTYKFNKYFKEKKEKHSIKLRSINVLFNDTSSIKKRFEQEELLIDNISFTRDLVSEPSNILTPDYYSEICESLSNTGLEIDVLEEDEMKKLGMNALLCVGEGSANSSKLVVMKWNGSEKENNVISFVGKGVTFDTGGISLKPSANMEDMKTDMAGSAVVVGLMKLLAERKAKVNAVGVIGLVENMPSGKAVKPGDVVTSMSGQTIEVINTDAEGRLVLSDALYYTVTKFKPEFVIDLATLTGAIIVSLSDVYAGLFSNDEKLAKTLIESGKKSNEKLWRMPIGEEYDNMINSDIADMKNVGSGRGAGSITAAQFLKRFVKDTKWAHIDIAGVALKGKGDIFASKGATGFGVELLNQFIKDNYEK